MVLSTRFQLRGCNAIRFTNSALTPLIPFPTRDCTTAGGCGQDGICPRAPPLSCGRKSWLSLFNELPSDQQQMQFRKPNLPRLGSSSHWQCGFQHSGFKRIAEGHLAEAAAVVDTLRQYPDTGDRLPGLTLKIAAQTESS